MARDAYRGTRAIQTKLRSLANQLEDRELQAKLAVADGVGIDVADLGGVSTFEGIEDD